MKNDLTYEVFYQDDENQKHLTYLTDLSAIKFLIDRFGANQVQYSLISVASSAR